MLINQMILTTWLYIVNHKGDKVNHLMLYPTLINIDLPLQLDFLVYPEQEISFQ